MDFRRAGLSTRAIALTWRTLLTGFCAATVLGLIVSHLYFVAVFAALITTLLIVSLAHLIDALDASSERDIQHLIAVEGFAGVPQPHPGPTGMSVPERAAAVLLAARARRQSQIEYFQALLDTVATALITVASDGRVRLVNRTARLMAARPVEFLCEISALGTTVAADLLALRPGDREIIRLPNGTRLLASVSQFAEPTTGSLRLLSLQRVTGELDAVELNAWSEMARVLAHEMMNSLTPIASLSASLESLVRRTGDSDTQRSLTTDEEILGALEAIARRSRGLIEFVQRYRAVADLPEPQYQEIHVSDLINGITRLLGPRLTSTGIELRAMITPGHLKIRADAQLLEQALLNLVYNSMDALTGSTPAVIEITCTAKEREVQIQVADTGCGIEPQLRDRVFIPFFTTKSGGSGIGLNLVRQIARAHRGQLELYANQPRGSVFVLLLPIGV